MSELQIALLAAGAALVVAVLAWNRIAEARARKRAESLFRPAGVGDPLVDAEAARREPTLGGGEPAGSPPPAHAPQASHAATVPASPAPAPAAPLAVAAPPTTAADTLPKAVLSPVADTVALVIAEAPASREQLAALERSTESIGRPVHVEGLEGERWVPVAESERDGWRELRVGLQLATRAGPASAEMVAAFNDAVATFAAHVGAVSQRENPAEAAGRARDLDALCAETDVELVLNVRGRSGATFAVPRVRELAAAEGLEPAGPGRFACYGDDGAPLYTLRFADVPPPRDSGYATGLTFAFDVPHAADASASLALLSATAGRFAAALAGDVVDDGGRPLTPAGLAAIQRSLAPVLARLAERGIPAGSPLARRLFA